MVGVGAKDLRPPGPGEVLGLAPLQITHPSTAHYRNTRRLLRLERWARADQETPRLRARRLRRVHALTRGTIADVRATLPGRDAPAALAAALHCLAVLTCGAGWRARHGAPHVSIGWEILDGPEKLEAIEPFLIGAARARAAFPTLARIHAAPTSRPTCGWSPDG